MNYLFSLHRAFLVTLTPLKFVAQSLDIAQYLEASTEYEWERPP